MKSKLATKFINKYLLPQRSILFKDEQHFEKFLTKRESVNAKKHKKPETLNVKSDLDKDALGDMQLFRFRFRHSHEKKILYIHGGYNIFQPSAFHWRFMDKLALSTLYEVVMPIYPKTPSFHLEDTYQAVLKVYEQLLSEVQAQDIVIMGDGTGGALALSFVQQLQANNQPLPNKVYLISPMLDAQLDNNEITSQLEDKDVIVKKDGLKKILQQWAGDVPLDDARISPINGNLIGLPPVFMLGGTREIYNPDMVKLEQILKSEQQPVHYFEYPKMVNAFALLPIRESHKVVKQIVNTINQ